MALLECGAKVNSRGLIVDDSRHALPLEAAIDSGDDMLVGGLLQRGGTVTSEPLATTVYVPWCSTRILSKVM